VNPLCRASPLLATAALAACAPTGVFTSPSAPKSSLHAFGVPGRIDPTEHGARVVPDTGDGGKVYGVEPGGGVRAIAAGVRFVSLPNGSVTTAGDRLPWAPSITTSLPERLGGGFLFVLDKQGSAVVWRADRWLAPAVPIYSSPRSLGQILVGLDRVYLRAQNGTVQAMDAKSGARLDLGPWPASSFVGSYAAIDGWRAVAIADLRGVVATTDAGATWKALGLSIDPQSASLTGDRIVVKGMDPSRQSASFEIKFEPDGVQAARISGAGTREASSPRELASATGDAERVESALSPLARPFGQRPLLAAIEDGWPLADDTAVVARDGTLARIRLKDGALVDLAPDAFPSKPAHCHPVSLANKSDPSAFGFVCGEPGGQTIVFAYEPGGARLAELAHFERPRVVLSAGNGALAVRGGCAPDAPDDDTPSETSYCVRAPPKPWREIHLRGDIENARVAVLQDGRVAVVSPPRARALPGQSAAANLGTAHLTVIDGSRATTVPITFPVPSPEIVRDLTWGVWLDGLEERRPGVLGGWVDAGGTILGIEIGLDGQAKSGAYVRDAGAPMVSGRYGLGWTASRRGYETTDGGMTWTPLELPEPIASDQAVRVRACGPIGCTARGWLRIGWGAPRTPEPPAPPPPFVPPNAAPKALSLDCEALGASPRATTAAADAATLRLEMFDGSLTHPSDMRPFYGAPAPVLRPDEVPLSVDLPEPLERSTRTAPLGRLYVWGPKSGEWPHVGHWIARWLWPFGTSQEVRSTTGAVAPFSTFDAAQRALGKPVFGLGFSPVQWRMGVGDDSAHALFIGQRGGQAESTLLEVEEGHSIVELHRGDNEPFGQVDAAVRAAGHWYLLTPQGPGELPAAVVWRVDFGAATELARVPRTTLDGRPAPGRLARRADGRAVGVLVEGQSAERSSALRWVVPIDLESGTAGEPEPLGAADLGDRAEVGVCTGEETGWVLDAPWNSTVRIGLGKEAAPTEACPPGRLCSSGLVDARPVTNLYGRFRVTRAGACLERLSGTLDMGSSGTDGLRKGPTQTHDAPSLPLSVLSGRDRFALRCIRRAF
jgi:hypothetical protein